MSSAQGLPPLPALPTQPRRSVWWAYLGLCLLAWTLYTVAGTDWLRGDGSLAAAAYEATWNLHTPMLLGTLVYPLALALRRSGGAWSVRLAVHCLAAAAFALACHAMDFALAYALFGADHASATLQQNLLWRSAWVLFIYLALVLGFNSVIDARRAQDAAMNAAHAEAALVRAELAAISGKLNPHFLFNTLNSITVLVRRDAKAAEQALQCFARLMRYLLDAKRGAADRVALEDELGFVRDYLELESLRLGPRLKIDWAVDERTLGAAIPPLTLQPLVENSIVHAIAPRIEGGTLRVQSRPQAHPPGLLLSVSDDGPGCSWVEPPAVAPPRSGGGVGLAALRRRFEVDFSGRSRLSVHTAPGQGFRVDIFIPEPEFS
jgi:Histidine kinase